MKVKQNLQVSESLSSLLKRIHEHHTEMGMDILEYFVCQKEIVNIKNIISNFSHGNCNSRYMIFSILNSSNHAIEDKSLKINKLDKMHNSLHKSIKDIFTEYGKHSVVCEETFKRFSQEKQDFFNFLTELIIEAEGFEKRFDGLTNFFNKKYFMEEVMIHFERIEFTIVMADIDHFKKINDTYGHQAGDYVLSELAKLYKSHLRKNDILGRYGGEEFIFFLHGGIESAHAVIERMRKIIEDHEFVFNRTKIKVTSSFGMVQKNGYIKLESLIEKADQALYKSKEEGRNRISLHKYSA
jgi:diguanylate cyclase (GGDEF)-like protein